MTSADMISSAGTAFGRNQLEAVEDLCDASGAAGPGLKWKDQEAFFWFALEHAGDTLGFYGDRAELALSLFEACAKLSFFGVVRSTQAQRTEWSNDRNRAYSALVEMERTAA